jgi:adenylate kinase
MEKEQKIIIISGAPGAGKGTQAELLAEKFGFYHMESSKIIARNLADVKKDDFVEVNGKKYFLLEEQNKKNSGILISPPLVTFWIKKKLREFKKEGKSVIMNGSPRTLYEGEELIPFLKELYGAGNIQVVLIELSEKDSIWRNTHRKTCELMGHTIIYNEETVKLTKCPFDGSKLLTRKDDKPGVIKIRLKEYEERTFPLIEFFEKQGLEVKRVDGAPAPAVVFENILKVL